ncbi:hypothetical protein PHJA_001199800 [Phtheirospermum japonicum]|uniref:Uncharacterized protein n=1 Tax=Phtheirospermum japonicum TaxID=374723 RepID=A0A830C013_9LAMI|nr:hypothetical protein PHJA_001199800 [Phtheirospermum japonicum]
MATTGDDGRRWTCEWRQNNTVVMNTKGSNVAGLIVVFQVNSRMYNVKLQELRLRGRTKVLPIQILERHVLPILTLLIGLIGATCRANICPSYCVTHIGTTCPPNSTDVILDIKPIDPLLNLFKDVFSAESLLFDFRYLELNSFKHKRGITVCVL